MKLNSQQLEAHLKSNLLPVYIISSDELLLKQEAFLLIRKAAKQAGFDERVRLTPTINMEWDELHSILHTNSLLGEKRLIELDFRQTTPNKLGSEILQEYANGPSPHQLLLIDLSKTDEKISKSAWYKALDKIGATLPIWPLSREQIPQWIISRAKKYKLVIPHDAANQLADYVEGNLSAAAQALEKLYLLQPQQAINGDLIQSVLNDESRFTLFDFIESVFLGDSKRSLHMLNTIKEDGTDPVLVTWGLARELRLLADLSEQIQQGAAVDPLLLKYRIFFRRQAAFKRFLKLASIDDCLQLLTRVADIDRIIKGALPGNAWDALELFCLRLV